MPDTTDDFFTTVTTSGTGNVWTDKDNVLDSSSGQATSVTDTLNLDLDNPKASAIPPGNIITDIQFTVQWFRGVGDAVNGELTITNGTKRTFVVSEPPSSGEVYTGDLAYWGINQNQALDFATGMNNQVLTLKMVDGTNSVAVGWVKCMFTYEAAPSNPTVSPAALF